MGFRESLNQAKPVYIAGGAALCLLAALVVAYRSMRPPQMPGARQPAVLKCADSACEHVLRTDLKFVQANQKLDPADPAAPGVRCPKCGKDALAWAYECPGDSTVFYKRLPNAPLAAGVPARAATPGPKCPRCGWDPIAEETERIAKSLRR